jgi:hypothetical protein
MLKHKQISSKPRYFTLKEVNCFRGLKAIGEKESPVRKEDSENETILLLAGPRNGCEEFKDKANEVNNEEEKRNELEDNLITSAIEQKHKRTAHTNYTQIPFPV